MPRFDRSGPWGQGPRTGGGFGLCGQRAQAGDDISPDSFNTMRGGRINRRAQRRDNRWGGGFNDAGQLGGPGAQRGGRGAGRGASGQGGGQRGGQGRGRGGRFNQNQAD